MLTRLFRGSAKLFYQLVWRIIHSAAKKPTLEVLYRNDDPTNGGIVLRCSCPVYVEPESGFLITEKGYLLEESLLPNFDYEKTPFEITVPSPFRFFRAVKANQVVSVSEAISLRHFWEWNYYHFYLDVLGKLELLETAGIDDSLPLILAKYADDVPFVRPLIGRGKYRGRRWVTPTAEYVKAESIVFCRTKRNYKSRILHITDSLEIEASARHEERRVFVKRSGTRQIVNQNEIDPVLEKYSFQVVDAAGMSMDEQIRVFSGTRYLIVNHGAGTTNILFRGDAPLSVLELHHQNYMNYDHKRMCDEMGYSWDDLVGSMEPGSPAHAQYRVSAAELEQKIIAMLPSPSPASTPLTAGR